MRALVIVSMLALSFGEACVIVADCNSRSCDGCCSSAGQCVPGMTTNACGSGGNTCAVCPATFSCSLGSCQPGSSSGGTGGGTGGGLGGGSGGGSGLGMPGDVTVRWNFATLSCAQVPEIATVRVAIAGQVLQNGGLYPCSSGGTDGIMLLDFRAGVYAYSVEALNTAGTVLYRAAGSLSVNGNVTLDLALNSTSTSALVSWTFPPNSASAAPDCTQAGVVNVTVSLSGRPAVSLACSTGFGAGAQLNDVSEGTQSVALEASDSNGFVYYRKTSTLTAESGRLLSNPYSLEWAVGSLPVKWSFSNGVTQLNCAQAGITQVNVNLRDTMGDLVYGPTGVDVPCLQGGIQGTEFPYLTGGGYALFLQAYGTGNVLYRTDFTTPPLVNVVEGQFPVLDGSTPTSLLTL